VTQRFPVTRGRLGTLLLLIAIAAALPKSSELSFPIAAGICKIMPGAASELISVDTTPPLRPLPPPEHAVEPLGDVLDAQRSRHPRRINQLPRDRATA
jgi:hypothetical protein